QFTYRQVPDSVDFQLVRARLRANAPGDAADIARGFANNIAEGKSTNMDAERYGYALALLRARQYDTARTVARRLADHAPDNMYYRVVQAEIEMASGRTDTGLQMYANAYKRSPSYYPLAIRYTSALIRAKHEREAEPIIRAAIAQRPDDPLLYDLLSQATGANGKVPESHQALAEHYYLNGDLNAAIEQLQLASRYAGNNFYLQSSLEARIQAIKEEVALVSQKK
ncbi:MAG: tetratricopeptide repeat protein, partial [Sulfurifustaceae bacterium]